MNKPKPLILGIIGLAVGVSLLVAGSQVSTIYAKDSLFGYGAFGLVLTGVVVTVLGGFKTGEGILRRILEKEMKRPKWLPPRFTEISPKALFQNLQTISYGVAISLIGSMVASSWAKFSIENYAGFGLLMAGLGTLIYGVFGMISAYIVGLNHAAPVYGSFKNIAYGAALLVIGSTTASLSAKYTIQNYLGFAIMLIGIFAVSFGIFGVISAGAKEYINKLKLIKPIWVQEKTLTHSLSIVAFAAAGCITGYIIADQWSVASIENYLGYGLLLVGTAALVTGHLGLVVAFALPRLTASRARQKLYAQLESTAELDSVTDEALIGIILDVERKLIAFLAGKEQLSITSLAYELGVSTDLAKRFLLRSLQHGMVYGYLTVDGQLYYTSDGFRKNLAEVLCKA